ncbi:Wall-associated receptor kinase 2 [Carex littledalei]|uniref:Wall-associated receptor kinase 2 n=1 Tax=Carex littledalei TaxID=544730 RepID=A0A833Q9T4_9POAL|nr:Wall-associated receptor kinase 2 [Carex littledalei]
MIKHGSCSGIGCCQTDIPKGTSTFMISFDERLNNSEVYNFSRCSYAMVVEAAMFNFNTTYITNEDLIFETDLPMVLDWAIGNTTCEEAQTNKTSYACRSSNSICSTVSGRDISMYSPDLGTIPLNLHGNIGLRK